MSRFKSSSRNAMRGATQHSAYGHALSAELFAPDGTQLFDSDKEYTRFDVNRKGFCSFLHDSKFCCSTKLKNDQEGGMCAAHHAIWISSKQQAAKRNKEAIWNRRGANGDSGARFRRARQDHGRHRRQRPPTQFPGTPLHEKAGLDPTALAAFTEQSQQQRTSATATYSAPQPSQAKHDIAHPTPCDDGNDNSAASSGVSYAEMCVGDKNCASLQQQPPRIHEVEKKGEKDVSPDDRDEGGCPEEKPNAAKGAVEQRCGLLEQAVTDLRARFQTLAAAFVEEQHAVRSLSRQNEALVARLDHVERERIAGWEMDPRNQQAIASGLAFHGAQVAHLQAMMRDPRMMMMMMMSASAAATTAATTHQPQQQQPPLHAYYQVPASMPTATSAQSAPVLRTGASTSQPQQPQQPQ